MPGSSATKRKTVKEGEPTILNSFKGIKLETRFMKYENIYIKAHVSDSNSVYTSSEGFAGPDSSPLIFTVTDIFTV